MSRPHDERGKVKGATEHAEGQHGERTHSHFLEQIHESASTDDDDDNIIARHRDEKHRLTADRQQHDEADKNSERNRLRDV
jgi:hypothetical protein